MLTPVNMLIEHPMTFNHDFQQVIEKLHRILEDIEKLSNTTNQQDIIENYRTLHPRTAECTSLSSAHERYTRINLILEHKTNLKSLKRLEIRVYFVTMVSYKSQ